MKKPLGHSTYQTLERLADAARELMQYTETQTATEDGDLVVPRGDVLALMEALGEAEHHLDRYADAFGRRSRQTERQPVEPPKTDWATVIGVAADAPWPLVQDAYRKLRVDLTAAPSMSLAALDQAYKDAVSERF